MQPALAIEHRILGNWHVVGVAGEIDLATAPSVEAAVDSWDGSRGLCVDLSEVTFVDSTGLRSLITAAEAASARNVPFCIVAPDGPVTKLLDVSGLTGLWDIHSSSEGLSQPVGVEERYTIELPDARSLTSARVFVVAVARIAGVDDDAIADLKLATSEAASLGLLHGRTVEVTVTVNPGRLQVVVGPAGEPEAEIPGPDPTDIITALFPDAVIGDTISFGLNLAVTS